MSRKVWEEASAQLVKLIIQRELNLTIELLCLDKREEAQSANLKSMLPQTMRNATHFSRISAIEEKQVQLEESVPGPKKSSIFNEANDQNMSNAVESINDQPFSFQRQISPNDGIIVSSRRDNSRYNVIDEEQKTKEEAGSLVLLNDSSNVEITKGIFQSSQITSKEEELSSEEPREPIYSSQITAKISVPETKFQNARLIEAYNSTEQMELARTQKQVELHNQKLLTPFAMRKKLEENLKRKTMPKRKSASPFRKARTQAQELNRYDIKDSTGSFPFSRSRPNSHRVKDEFRIFRNLHHNSVAGKMSQFERPTNKRQPKTLVDMLFEDNLPLDVLLDQEDDEIKNSTTGLPGRSQRMLPSRFNDKLEQRLQPNRPQPKRLNFQNIYAQGSQGQQVTNSLREKKGSADRVQEARVEQKEQRPAVPAAMNRKQSSRISYNSSSLKKASSPKKLKRSENSKQRKESADNESQILQTRVTEPDTHLGLSESPITDFISRPYLTPRDEESRSLVSHLNAALNPGLIITSDSRKQLPEWNKAASVTNSRPVSKGRDHLAYKKSNTQTTRRKDSSTESYLTEGLQRFKRDHESKRSLLTCCPSKISKAPRVEDFILKQPSAQQLQFGSQLPLMADALHSKKRIRSKFNSLELENLERLEKEDTAWQSAYPFVMTAQVFSKPVSKLTSPHLGHPGASNRAPSSRSYQYPYLKTSLIREGSCKDKEQMWPYYETPLATFGRAAMLSSEVKKRKVALRHPYIDRQYITHSPGRREDEDPGKRKSITQKRKMKTVVMPWEMAEIAKRRQSQKTLKKSESGHFSRKNHTTLAKQSAKSSATVGPKMGGGGMFPYPSKPQFS